MVTSNFLTVRQTAERLGISTQFVYVLLWSKKLAGHKIGKRWFISKASIVAREKGKETQWQMTT